MFETAQERVKLLKKGLSQKEIEMIELSTDKIIADVRGYSVHIDLDKRFILPALKN